MREGLIGANRWGNLAYALLVSLLTIMPFEMTRPRIFLLSLLILWMSLRFQNMKTEDGPVVLLTSFLFRYLLKLII